MINIKYCKKCKAAFDIGVMYDECPSCRKENKLEVEKDGSERG